MQFFLSLVLWVAGLLHFAMITIVGLPLLLLLPARKFFPLARWLCRNQLRVMGCPLEVLGLDKVPRDRGVLLLGNHESLFDVFAVGGALPSHAIGLEAAQHFKMPAWGRITRAWGNLPLPEGKPAQAKTTFRRAAEVLASGTNVIILPEGHRTRTGSLGELQRGAFRLAMRTHADIQPFVLQGLYEFHNTHSWRLHPRTLRVVYGDVIPFESFADATVEELKERIRHELLKLEGDDTPNL